MGRDFTPREQHWADKAYGISAGRLVMVLADGTEEVLRDPDGEIEKAYPNFAFLGHGTLSALLAEGRSDTAVEVERLLSVLIDADDSGALSEPECELGKMTYKWYCGKLDPHFHYRETNDEMFTSALMEVMYER